MKETITEQENYMLIGLAYLANKKIKELEDLMKAGRELVGETDECGHISDEFLSGEASADSILNKLKIYVSLTGD